MWFIADSVAMRPVRAVSRSLTRPLGSDVRRRAMWWLENVGGRTFRPSAIAARPCPECKSAPPGPLLQLGFPLPSSPRRLRILLLIDARVRIVLPMQAVSTEDRLKPPRQPHHQHPYSGHVTCKYGFRVLEKTPFLDKLKKQSCDPCSMTSQLQFKLI